jgi:hypothetical protein
VRTYRPIQTFCCGPRKALTRRGRGPGRSNLNTRERWGLHRDDTEVSGGESSPSRALGEEVETWFAPGSRGSVVVPYRVRCWETSQVRVHWQAVLRKEKPYNRPKSRGPPRGEACRRQRGHVQVGLLAADHSRASEEQFECESVRV